MNALKILAPAAFAVALAASPALAQTPPSPAPTAEPASSAVPAASAAPAAPGAFDLNSLTPAQREALQAAIIKSSQNPVGNIAIVPFQFNNNYGIGPYTRYQFNLNIQPVVPIMLSKDLNLIARTIVPIVDNPSGAPPGVCASAGCPSTFGLSDIQEQLFFAPKTAPGAMIYGIGPMFQLPTASPGVLGTGQWSAGPAAVALFMPGRWVAGMLATQIWSVTGKTNAPIVNNGLFQPFVNYNIPGGWAISMAPIVTANYTAPGNQKWSIPLGGGGTRTFKIDDQAVQIGLFYYTYVQKPLYTPQTNLKVVFSLLYPIKRGVDMQELIKENLGL